MEKESNKEKIRYLEIAKGSTAEFATQTHIGMNIGYILQNDGTKWLENADHILSMLTNLQKSLLPRT